MHRTWFCGPGPQLVPRWPSDGLRLKYSAVCKLSVPVATVAGCASELSSVELIELNSRQLGSAAQLSRGWAALLGHLGHLGHVRGRRQQGTV